MVPESRINNDISNNSIFLPIESAETISSDYYINPYFHKFDQQNIISKSWQYAGNTSQLKESGDYFTIEIAGNPVLLIKDKDSQIRAFYNICRHRAGPIAMNCGNTKVLQCRYHGWLYDFQGNLKKTREFEGVENFNSSEYGLIPVNLEIWEGLIFINLDKKPLPFSGFFGGIKERIQPLNLEKMDFHSRVKYDIDCNWKVYTDNYLEGYHLPFVHPELNRVLDYKQYVTELYEFYSLQYSPFTDSDNFYGIKDGQAFYYYIYPNMMLNILPGRLQINLVVPVSENKCRVIFDE